MTKCIWTSLTYCRLTKIKYLLECFIKGGQDKISTVYEVSAVVLEMMRCADVILVLLQFLTIFWSHLLPHIVCDHLDTCPVSSFIFVICPSVSCVLLPPPPVPVFSCETVVNDDHLCWHGGRQPHPVTRTDHTYDSVSPIPIMSGPDAATTVTNQCGFTARLQLKSDHQRHIRR